MAVASNIRAQRNREQGKDVNPKLVTTAILKNVAEFPKISLVDLMSRTKFPEESIRQAIEDLQSEEWLKGDEKGYILTPEGLRASYIVSS